MCVLELLGRMFSQSVHSQFSQSIHNESDPSWRAGRTRTPSAYDEHGPSKTKVHGSSHRYQYDDSFRLFLGDDAQDTENIPGRELDASRATWRPLRNVLRPRPADPAQVFASPLMSHWRGMAERALRVDAASRQAVSRDCPGPFAPPAPMRRPDQGAPKQGASLRTHQRTSYASTGG
jgi:hypothetical protein